MDSVKDILLIIFHVLFFPGVLFSAVVGLLLAGIERQFTDLFRKRKVFSLLQPFKEIYALLKSDNNQWGKIWTKPVFILLIVGLLCISAAPMFIPILGVTLVKNGGSVVILMYMMTIPLVTLLIIGLLEREQDKSIKLLNEVFSRICFQIIFLGIVVAVAGKAAIASKEHITFSLESIIQYQITGGVGITKWQLIPAALSFFMIIPAVIGSFPFNITEFETAASDNLMNENNNKYIFVYKCTKAVKTTVSAMIFIEFFIGFGIIGLTGIYAINLIISILVWFIMAALLITAAAAFGKAASRFVTSSTNIKLVWIIPSSLMALSLILVYLKL